MPDREPLEEFVREFADWWEQAGSVFYEPGRAVPCRRCRLLYPLEDEGLQGLAAQAAALVAELDDK